MYQLDSTRDSRGAINRVFRGFGKPVAARNMAAAIKKTEPFFMSSFFTTSDSSRKLARCLPKCSTWEDVYFKGGSSNAIPEHTCVLDPQIYLYI